VFQLVERFVQIVAFEGGVPHNWMQRLRIMEPDVLMCYSLSVFNPDIPARYYHWARMSFDPWFLRVPGTKVDQTKRWYCPLGTYKYDEELLGVYFELIDVATEMGMLFFRSVLTEYILYILYSFFKEEREQFARDFGYMTGAQQFYTWDKEANPLERVIRTFRENYPRWVDTAKMNVNATNVTESEDKDTTMTDLVPKKK